MHWYHISVIWGLSGVVWPTWEPGWWQCYLFCHQLEFKFQAGFFLAACSLLDWIGSFWVLGITESRSARHVILWDRSIMLVQFNPKCPKTIRLAYPIPFWLYDLGLCNTMAQTETFSALWTKKLCEHSTPKTKLLMGNTIKECPGGSVIFKWG